MFGPLYRSKAGGLDIGLAIGRAIVDAHRLSAATSVHGGATVGLSLPAGTEDKQ